MIIAIDIGGTKTLVASVTDDGQVIEKLKFPSPKNYKEFIQVLKTNIDQLAKQPIIIISIGCAGVIDRSTGVIKNSPNLGWINTPLVPDLKQSYKMPIIIENDANLAGLSEAHCLDNIGQRVMYITFSTGVGTGFIINGELSKDLLESEGGRMVFEHEGKMMDWESFAAGRAIVQKYGKLASELNDPVAWKEISKNMALGIVDNCSVFSPDTVIIGGGVGTYFDKFGDFLNTEIDNLFDEAAIIKKPVIVGAKNAEEAVLLGCIIIAQQYEQRQ